jgi:uncharacterized protein DUF4058
MPSPFPGMDPYLEGHLCPDVHHRLTTEIVRRLTPLLRPKYVARIEVYVTEDETPEAEIGIIYPDVSVLDRERTSRRKASTGEPVPAEKVTEIQAPITIPVLAAVEVRVPVIEIRDAASNVLVTGIEIISQVNKREPGLTRYRQKRERMREAGVHLLELDLLRRGTRPLSAHPRLPASHYLMTLTRSRAQVIEVWPVSIRDPLPVLPVPLRQPDADIALDLSKALAAIYEEAAYDLSLNYRQTPPPPPLAPEDEAWREGVVARAGP